LQRHIPFPLVHKGLKEWADEIGKMENAKLRILLRKHKPYGYYLPRED
jgi:hypothetical protein